LKAEEGDGDMEENS
jgi:hypothetical protein